MTIRSDVSVDWSTSPRLLTVAAPSTEITVQDIVDTCRNYEDMSPNSSQKKLIDAAGKEFLGGTTYVGITATMQNAVLAFESRAPGPNWILCTISGGNLVAVDAAGAVIDPRYPTAFVTVDRTASASATLQEQSAIQYASFGGGVTVDIINGTAGTEYPIGTIEDPVDNLTDAVAIANSRGFVTLFINESMTLDAGTDITDFSIVGRSRVKTAITFDTTALCDGVGISNCDVDGVLDGNVQIDNCNVGDLLYVYGQVSNSALYGTITLAGNKDAYLADCSVLDPNSIPVIDMGGSGQDIILVDWSGGITFRNMTGANKIGIQIDGGRVTLDSTISAGFVGLTGTGEVLDNSTGTTVVSTSGLMSKETIGEAVYDEVGTEIQYAAYQGFVAIDVVGGVAGTAYDIGTLANPVNNITDAKTIAVARGFETFYIQDDLTLVAGDDVTGYTFEANGYHKTTITIDALALTTDCIFNKCGVTGTLGGNNELTDCRICNLHNVNGEAVDCRLYGTTYVDGGSDVVFRGCGTAVSGSPAIVDMGGSGQNAMFHDWSGGLKFLNMTGDQQIRVQLDGGQINLDPTLSAGFVQIVGIGIMTDNSTGTCNVVTDGLLSKDTISNAIWDIDLTEHTTVNTAGKIVQQIKSIVGAIIGLIS